MAAKNRYMTLGVLAIAALVGLVSAHGLNWAANALELANPALLGLRELPLGSTLGYAVGAGFAAFVLLRHGPRTWAGEVVDELFRVNWPSRAETTHATLVVMVCVVVCATFLGLFDAAWLWLSGLLMGSQTTTG